MLKILFICTHNRCRSILAEAITNHLAAGKLLAYSAGSAPAGAVYPATLEQLQRRGIKTEGLQSQSWDEFAALKPDIIITVCDQAAKETCPAWFNDGIQLHWSLVDPSKLSDAAAEQAFAEVIAQISSRINKLLALPLAEMDTEMLRKACRTIA